MKILLLKPVAMVEGEESSAGIGREVRKDKRWANNEHLKNLFSLARGNFVFEWDGHQDSKYYWGVGGFFVSIHGQVYSQFQERNLWNLRVIWKNGRQCKIVWLVPIKGAWFSRIWMKCASSLQETLRKRRNLEKPTEDHRRVKSSGSNFFKYFLIKSWIFWANCYFLTL